MSDSNDKNISKLKELQEKDEPLAVLVGAGPSNPLGIREWTPALIELGKQAKVDPNLTEKLIREEGYPKAASYIFKEINNEKNILNFWKKYLNQLICIVQKFTKKLLKILIQ